MSFQTGLSGLNASSRNLDVIGHNIANVNTVGMKASRAEFGDIVAMSLGAAGSASAGAGIGVKVATIAQQFTQGNISTTGNSLDVAINGSGFLQLTMLDGSSAYTRDGQLKLDKDGFIRANNGAYVMGFPTDKAGKPLSASIGKLQMPTSAPIPATATQKITAEFNLDARALNATQAAAAGKAADPRSTYGTSLDVYDAQGVPSPLTLYFVKKDGVNNEWEIYTSLTAATPVGTMTFDNTGKITGPSTGTGIGITLAAGTVPSSNPNEPTGFIQTPIDLDLSKVTQYGAAFAVSNLTQDGYTAGDLTGLTIGSDGVITARYSNGQTQAAGQLALADFRNVQGLIPLGGNAWAASYESGLPVQGSPSQGRFGALRAGALEDSNVDLTSELVNMMTAQRAYQANAQTIKTQDQVMSTLLNLR